ncbi:hypothetical protein BX666DRAFT_1000164 [Dichotomocladium elegans]|nr:hypothetical protein BX666DRAFT_1000164 [Dichotomocladium elegans]
MTILVSLILSCHTCTRQFFTAPKLRNHLFSQHGIEVASRPSGKRRHNTPQFMYIKKASDASHSLIVVHYEFPSCLDHYATLDELRAHITLHVKKKFYRNKKGSTATSREGRHDSFDFDPTSSADGNAVSCKGSLEDPPLEVEEHLESENNENNAEIGLRSFVTVQALLCEYLQRASDIQRGGSANATRRTMIIIIPRGMPDVTEHPCLYSKQ